MPKKHYLTIAAAAMLGVSSFSSALAGTEMAAPGKESKAVTPPCPVTYITGDFGVTFVSEYLSRGIVEDYQNKGVIAQPYLDLYIKLYSGDANSWGINSVSAQLSFWSDIGSNRKTSPPYSTAPHWYEFDWDPGISVTFAQKFTLTTQYFEFDSPANAFKTARSIDMNLTYDDSGFMGPFALHPHFTGLYELTGSKAGAGPGSGTAGLKGHAWYWELGIAPSYTFLPKSSYPITLAIPATVGFSGQAGFYGSSTPGESQDWFGYFSVGPAFSVPLAFIPSGYGSWTVTAAYTYYTLGDGPQDASPDLKRSQHVFSGALGCTF